MELICQRIQVVSSASFLFSFFCSFHPWTNGTETIEMSHKYAMNPHVIPSITTTRSIEIGLRKNFTIGNWKRSFGVTWDFYWPAPDANRAFFRRSPFRSFVKFSTQMKTNGGVICYHTDNDADTRARVDDARRKKFLIDSGFEKKNFLKFRDFLSLWALISDKKSCALQYSIQKLCNQLHLRV